MTKKHFKLIAEALRKSRPRERLARVSHAQWQHDVATISLALELEFDTFNPEEFLAACRR